MKFPDDFVAYSTTYGSGTLRNGDDDCELPSVCRSTYPAIVEGFSSRNREFREAAETHDVGLGLFPEPGGLLPFGKSSSGTYFCWDTTNKSPNDWPVVVMWEYDHDGYNRQKGGAISFLHGLLSGQKSRYFWGCRLEAVIADNLHPQSSRGVTDTCAGKNGPSDAGCVQAQRRRTAVRERRLMVQGAGCGHREIGMMSHAVWAIVVRRRCALTHPTLTHLQNQETETEAPAGHPLRRFPETLLSVAPKVLARRSRAGRRPSLPAFRCALPLQ